MELLLSTAGMGDGVRAVRHFRFREVVVRGHIEAELAANHSHASQIGEHRFVLHGGLSSKVNHSCEPNCGISVNLTGAHDLVARRDIEPGEQISFDYAMRNHTVDHFTESCQCGHPDCRGLITGWKDLPAQRKTDYTGFIAPYLLDIDTRLTSPR
ncbi:SET domain-containing protein-lysine N-methyltransferase [Actinokineospora sp. NBRC 105648]|uniref:SET domain-containing protein-lysine N-methyltransferase n=1 Tax=Actinokineospora sp. NBRC 105648 TaxID=3032206 RepID=UPI00255708F5|nr:SET domain-containing protein-lysine N-methyltransferase [Actinokineospora sp. NBRC 105648]